MSLSAPNRWAVLGLVCVAQFMVILDATIVNVALPTIERSLHFSPTSLQWIVNAYTLVFGGFLLLGGRAADLFGTQRLFISGLVLFTGASLLNGLATSSGILVAGRAAQGLGAALVSPAALAIVTRTFREGAERTKALGIWSAIAAGGGAAGLLLGGVLTETLSWRWIFFINLPIGILAGLLALRMISNEVGEEKPDTSDVAGAVTVTGGLLVLVYAIVKAESYGWGSAKTLGLFAAAIVLLAAFVVIELRSRAPLIRLDIFRTRSLSTANAAMLLVASGLFAMFFFASLYTQQLRGYSPIQAGLAFLPFTFGIVIGAGLAQTGIRRLGVRAVTLTGLSIATVGMLLFTQLSLTGSYLGELFPAVSVTSIGLGLTFVPVTLLATTNVPSEDAGLASGLFNTSQQIGGALGSRSSRRSPRRARATSSRSHSRPRF
jgi:EmrB/QacA subfamily drug resistance transporter